jgi:plasmid maintenance system antidote protein VapI
MANQKKTARDADVAVRLRLLRAVIEGEETGAVTRFARRIGITVPRWSNFEGGLPLSKDVAIRLVQQIPGLTLDWLYLGRRAGLSVELDQRLDNFKSSGRRPI